MQSSRQDALTLRCWASTLALLIGVITGCREDSLLVFGEGTSPVADARVVGKDGKMVTFELGDSTLEVTLDATHSSDRDGRVVSYRWLSATPLSANMADSGVAGSAGTGAAGRGAAGGGGAGTPRRWVPEGQSLDWPEDIAMPKVQLGAGNYSFTLWVFDDDGEISKPDTVDVEVTAPAAP